MRKENYKKSKWYEEFKSAVESDNTLICDDCGYTLIGDSPAIHILCKKCYDKKSKIGKPFLKLATILTVAIIGICGLYILLYEYLLEWFVFNYIIR